MLESREQPVELIALKVQLGEPAHRADLAVEVLRLVKRPPVHLDGFIRPILLGKRACQSQRDLRVIGVQPHRSAQGVKPFLGLAQPETKLGKELVALRVPRRGGK